MIAKILDYVEAVRYYEQQRILLSREWRKTDFQDPVIHRAYEDNEDHYERYYTELQAALLEWVESQTPKKSDYNAIAKKTAELADLLKKCSEVLRSCADEWAEDE